MKPKRKFTVLIEQDEEGFYVATVPALHGCNTQAKTLDAFMKRVREVIQLCLEDDNNGAACGAFDFLTFSTGDSNSGRVNT